MIHHAPLRLWREARQVLRDLWHNFTSPTAIAHQCVFTRPARDKLCEWLRGAEAMLRALLFMEAVALCVAGNLPASKPRAPRVRAPRQKRVHDPDFPDAWRVRFRMFDPVRKPKRRARKFKTAPPLGPHLYNAWPLAERAEACLRAFNAPEPYVRRLARKLGANRALRLRINTRNDGHERVIRPLIWDETCMDIFAADVRLCDTS